MKSVPRSQPTNRAPRFSSASGSSNSCCISSILPSALSQKRSIRWTLSLWLSPLLVIVDSLRCVVSTTSVAPSHRPTEWPTLVCGALAADAAGRP